MSRIVVEKKDITIVLKYNFEKEQFFISNILDIEAYQPKKEDFLIISFKFFKRNNSETFYFTDKAFQLFETETFNNLSEKNQKLLNSYISFLESDSEGKSIKVEDMFFDEGF